MLENGRPLGDPRQMRLSEPHLAGIYPVVPTPFDSEGGLDAESITRLCAFMAEQGVQGVTVLGVMGEAQKLSDVERIDVLRIFRETLSPDLALVVGVSGAATDPVVAAAGAAVRAGADALLVGPIPSQDDEIIFQYYQRVAGAVEIPIVIHDYPASTGVVMSARFIARLHEGIRNVPYVKLEDPPTGPKIDKVRELTNGEMGIFGALGGLYAFEELDRGAIGLMTGFAYPELLVEIYRRFMAGDRDGAAQVFYDILPLIRFEFQPSLGVALRKHVLVKRGVFRTAAVRHPGREVDAKTVEHLNRILDYLRVRGYDV